MIRTLGLRWQNPQKFDRCISATTYLRLHNFRVGQHTDQSFPDLQSCAVSVSVVTEMLHWENINTIKYLGR